MDGIPQAAGVEAAPPRIFYVPAVGKCMCVDMLHDVIISSVDSLTACWRNWESGASLPQCSAAVACGLALTHTH